MRRTLLVMLVVASVVALIAINSNLIVLNRKRVATEPPTAAAEVRSDQAILVAVQDFEAESIEVLATYSGLVRPWERYSLGFEIGGRVEQLGVDAEGHPIDEGSTVDAGTLLAQLDSELLESQVAEAEASLAQANSHYRRTQQLRERGNSAVTDAEFQDRLAAKLLAEAQSRMATKRLADARLTAPAAGVVSRRFVNAGESVSPHAPAFELVEIKRVLLVVGVPEASLGEILARKRIVDRNARLANQASIEDEDQVFRAYVELIGRDRFGDPWPLLAGQVYRVSETADQRSGLFEVEIELPNPERRLKPGMVARANLVTDRIRGIRVPVSSVIFRDNRAYLYVVEPIGKSNPIELAKSASTRPSDAQPDASKTPTPDGLFRARRIELTRWTEQGGDVIAPLETERIANVVVRGQHRLTEGHLVRLADATEASPPASAASLSAHRTSERE
ncbi:MAG: efflux RND transporter periplasmic adaptor subunit [Planctomycetales bacterium]|nr:efflux RND transporter periplasmic adaptor subunit [Planctomycetales bacterium]